MREKAEEEWKNMLALETYAQIKKANQASSRGEKTFFHLNSDQY